MFFYVGIGLVLLALVFLPAKIRVGGTPEQVDVDYYSVGWLSAFIIESYGLASLVFGIIEVTVTKESRSIFESFFLMPLLIPICLWTLFIVMATIPVGFNAPDWWLALIIHSTPGITVLLVMIIGAKKREYLVKVLKRNSVKIAISIMLIAFPLVHIAIVLQSTVLVWVC